MDERTEAQYMDIMAGQQLQQQMGMNAMNTQQQLMYQEQEKGLAAEQLDVNEIIKNIFKLITGKKIEINPEGQYEWKDSTDDLFKIQLKVLSDYGVQKVMEKVIFYINKNTLLSNYKSEEINRIMFDFTTCLNDFMLMRYEGFFYEPTFEECVTILKKKMEYKEKLRAYTVELLGEKPDKAKIKAEVIAEMENKVESEIERIKADELEKRINEYDSVVMQIEHQVLSTYMRAEGGTERSSLRKHASFTEVRSLQPEQKKSGGFSWLKG
jgi:hypothetical protein